MLYCLAALTEVPMVQLALLFWCKSDVNRSADQRFYLCENVERERYGIMSIIQRIKMIPSTKILPFIYEARVRFETRVRVRVRVRDSAIFEKSGCGCGRTRRLKNY